MHGRFALAHTHRLHEDRVEPGRLAEQDGLPRLAGHAAQRTGARAGADKGVGIVTEGLHARLVAQDAALGAFRARVDGQHGQFVPARGQVGAEGLDKGALAGTRHARDADAHGAALRGDRLAAADDLLRYGAMLRQVALHQGDGLAQDGRIAGGDALHILIYGENFRFLPIELFDIRVHDGRLLDAFVDNQTAVFVVVVGEEIALVCNGFFHYFLAVAGFT